MSFCHTLARRGLKTSRELRKKIIPDFKGGKGGYSSYQWIERQINDPYVKRAKIENYRARSVFKLMEIDDRFKLLHPGKVVIDCGSAPGSWTQLIAARVNATGNGEKLKKGTVIAVDLNHMEAIEGAILLCHANILDKTTHETILRKLAGRRPDIILSDMAPDASGIKDLDHEVIMQLVYGLLKFTLPNLKLNGNFLCKVWDGFRVPQLVKDLERFFETVRRIKPDASRTESAESFVLARNFKGPGIETDAKLKKELLAINLKLRHVESLRENVKSDVTVIQGAAKKTRVNTTQVQKNREQQDSHIARLLQDLEKLKKKVGTNRSQHETQKDECEHLKKMLLKANVEVEMINLEKKQLTEQWNHSLLDLKRRDEALFGLQEEFVKLHEQLRGTEAELQATRRSVNREIEYNHQTSMSRHQQESQLTFVEESLVACRQKTVTISEERAELDKTINSIQQNLETITKEMKEQEASLKKVCQQVDNQLQVKHNLEKEITTKTGIENCNHRTFQQLLRQVETIREKIKYHERQVIQTESNLSNCMMFVEATRTQNQHLTQLKRDLEMAVDNEQKAVNQQESDMQKCMTTVDKSQRNVNILHSKIEHITNAASESDSDGGPLETQLNLLRRSLETLTLQSQDTHMQWQRQQVELAKFLKEKEEITNANAHIEHQLTVYTQRKLRLEDAIDKSRKDIKNLENGIENEQYVISKLNEKFSVEKGKKEAAQLGNKLLEGNAMHVLTESEMELIESRNRVEARKETRDELIKKLIEADHEVCCWEERVKLAKETKWTVKDQTEYGENKALREQLHQLRMQYNQLCQTQKHLAHKMEKAVFLQDSLFGKEVLLAKSSKKAAKKTAGQSSRQVEDMKKTIRDLNQTIKLQESETDQLHRQQHQILANKELTHKNLQSLQVQVEELESRLLRQHHTKSQMFEELLIKQQQVKLLQKAREGHYRVCCKSVDMLSTAIDTQLGRSKSLKTIILRLIPDFPEMDTDLKHILGKLDTLSSVVSQQYGFH